MRLYRRRRVLSTSLSLKNLGSQRRIPPLFCDFTTSKCFPWEEECWYLVSTFDYVVVTIGWRIMFGPQSGPAAAGANAFQFLRGWCWSERSLSRLQPDMIDAEGVCTAGRLSYIFCSVVAHFCARLDPMPRLLRYTLAKNWWTHQFAEGRG